MGEESLSYTDSKASSDPAATRPAKKLNSYAVACAMLGSMNSTIMGYDVSVMSGAALFIKDDLKISDTQVEIVAGIINLFSLLGSLAAGRTSDWIGRRYTVLVAACIFLSGALLMGLAPNYGMLVVGRFFAGIGVGFALQIAPVYTAEVAPTSARGSLSSLPEVFVNVGILLGFVSNFALSGLPQHLAWRVMLLLGGVPPIFLAIGVLVMPESPRWLVLQGRIGEAKRVLAKVSDSPEEAAIRLESIKEAAGIPESCTDDVITPPNKNSGKGVWKELLINPKPHVRRIVIATLGLQFFQQVSGIDSVVLYSPRVFDYAGLKTKSQSLGATVVLGVVKTLFILVSTFFLDRVGRRPLLLTSSGGMVVSASALGIGLTVIERNPDQKLTWAIALCVVAVLCFVAFFSMGLGPITWVYCSEVFQVRLRAQGMGMGVALNRVMSGVVGMSFISLYKTITLGGSFLLYAGMALLGTIFFYFYLPETRGKTLEEAERLFMRSKDPKVEEDHRGEVELHH